MRNRSALARKSAANGSAGAVRRKHGRALGTSRSRANVLGRRHERIALVLQGGGALGAYQAGVYEAISELGYTPDWVAGVSIGAINAALIAGNAPERRVERLREFWSLVSSGLGEIPAPPITQLRAAYNRASAARAAILGVPGFFTVRTSPPNSGDDSEIPSVYDAAPLRATLERLVDFDRINSRAMRFSVGVVNVTTSESIYFDNETQTIGPEHVLASGALPPGFPAVKIHGEFYWDGGIVDNTPLQYVLDDQARVNTLAFQADLFNSRSDLPSDLAEVMKRRKEIQYSSRTRHHADALIPHDDSAIDEPQGSRGGAAMDVVHLTYQSALDEHPAAGYEFSRASIEQRWHTGYSDVMGINAHPERLVATRPGRGVRVYEISEAAKRPDGDRKRDRQNAPHTLQPS